VTLYGLIGLLALTSLAGAEQAVAPGAVARPDTATTRPAGLSAPQAVAEPAIAAGQRLPRSAAAVWAGSLDGAGGVSPDVTVRNIVRVSVAGSGVRVRLGNPFGTIPLVVQQAWIGRPVAPGAAALVPGSNRRLTFAGRTEVIIAPGADVLSDSVRIAVEAQQDLAVSLYAPAGPVSEHTFPPFAYDPPASYLGAGNVAADPSAAAFPSVPVISGLTPSTAVGYHPGQTWWLDLVVSDRPAARGTLVTLGDSITDGYFAIGPPGQRWTDVLAARMNALPAEQRLAIANAGISGNTVSVQPNPYDPTGNCCGPPAPRRLDRDVLSVPGLRAVLLLEGTNDINGGGNAPPASAAQIIAAMTDIAARVHARGARIIGATILPMGKPAGGPQNNVRLAVNQWMVTSGVFDAVLDFDAVLRDPADPTQLIGALRYDGFHPNAAGDLLLGTSIPLDVFGPAKNN
jgi:lysophospholipase L1-like esterase